MNITGYPFGRPESLKENFVIAAYRVYGVTEMQAVEKFGNYAVGQTVGTWMKVPGITAEMIEHFQARITDFQLISKEPEEVFLLKVAFPTANFAGSFAAMLTGLLGNDVSTSLEVRLVNLEFTNDSIRELGYIKKSRTPIKKLRDITGVTDRPLILNMIKPCLGFDEDTGSAFFREVAAGGVDLIKDDELLTNPHYNQVTNRIHAYQKAAREAAQITGRECVYIPNITDRPENMHRHAEAAVKAGAKACMVNYVFTGLDAFAEVCRQYEKELFVMGHYAGMGIMAGDRCGVSNPVYLGMLARIAGADTVMTMFPGGAESKQRMDCYQTIHQQMAEMEAMDKMVTTLGGGITPLHIPAVTEWLGNDVIIGIGGAIQGHPMGPTEGARAAMTAAEAAAGGVELKEAAATCEPLQKALELWA